MGKARGVNSGGGESSLGYLFGSSESVSKPNKPKANTSFTTTTTTTTTTDGAGGRPKTTTTTTTTGDKNKTEEISAGVRNSPNNYFRSDGQNCGNFLTMGLRCTQNDPRCGIRYQHKPPSSSSELTCSENEYYSNVGDDFGLSSCELILENKS